MEHLATRPQEPEASSPHRAGHTTASVTLTLGHPYTQCTPEKMNGPVSATGYAAARVVSCQQYFSKLRAHSPSQVPLLSIIENRSQEPEPSYSTVLSGAIVVAGNVL
jgi:hypothetical protein